MQVPQSIVDPLRHNPHVATFSLAYIVTKFTEPVRLLVTVAITPRIAKWVRARKNKRKDQDEDKTKKKRKDNGNDSDDD